MSKRNTWTQFSVSEHMENKKNVRSFEYIVQCIEITDEDRNSLFGLQFATKIRCVKNSATALATVDDGGAVV